MRGLGDRDWNELFAPERFGSSKRGPQLLVDEGIVVSICQQEHPLIDQFQPNLTLAFAMRCLRGGSIALSSSPAHT